MTEKKGIWKYSSAAGKEKPETGLQSFKLVKNFSFSSLVLFLVFTVFLSLSISNHTRDVMLKQSEEYSLLLAENLNQQVFRRFVLEAVVRYGGITLSNPVQFDHLDKIVRSIIQGLKIDSVTIYDSRKNIISFSTVPHLVGKENVGGKEYKKALAGIPNSELIYSGRLQSVIPGRPGVRCKLKTFIPFRQVKENGENSQIIMGVIEITKDLSREYGEILKLQSRIVVVSGVVMGTLFIFLSVIASRAGKKMEQRALERLRLEEKLNRAERLAHLGSMVATVSHEIKSPLGIVRSTAEILVKRLKKIAPGNENLAEIIVNETKRLNAIVMEFLDFARPQEICRQAEDVNGIVRKAVSFIDPQIRELKVELEIGLTEEPLIVKVDEEKLYRALLNILVNAMQALRENGLLQVSTKKGREGGAIISIRDNGIGVAEGKLDQIFKPFFTDKMKGTGLGLAITKNIIDGHKGEITVMSKEDEGTVFQIFLP